MHWDTLKQDNYSTVRGDGEVGSARYEPALLPPCPSIRFYATVTVRDPPNHTSSIRVKGQIRDRSRGGSDWDGRKHDNAFSKKNNGAADKVQLIYMLCISAI